MPYERMVDILFGYDTDIYFEGGDLMTTTEIDFIEREIYKILITEPGQWKSDLNLGASPEEFTGYPNTRDTAAKLQDKLNRGLRNIVLPGQISSRVIPVDYDKITVLLELFVQGVSVTTFPFEFDFINELPYVDQMEHIKHHSTYTIGNVSYNDVVVYNNYDSEKPIIQQVYFTKREGVLQFVEKGNGKVWTIQN